VQLYRYINGEVTNNATDTGNAESNAGRQTPIELLIEST
jgi:hypothetical protein